MSYDLAVWWSDRPTPSREALSIYEALCDGHDASLRARPEVGAFVAAMSTAFPLNLGAEDAPWSDTPEVTPRHALFCIQPSRAGSVAARVKELALEHGLVLFDPQRSIIEWPPALEAMPHARLSDCDERVLDEPSPAELRSFLARVGGDNWFAIMSRAPQRYAQTAFGPNARVTAVGAWQLEVRDGGPERHFARDATFEEVVATFRAIQTDAAWKVAGAWHAVGT